MSIRHTKIIATVGPSSSSDAVLRDLIAAGVDVFRLNFSHGTHQTHGETAQRIRELADRAGRPIALLQDLSGPKIRTGALEGGTPIALEPGQELVIAAGDFVGGPGRVSTTYAPLMTAVKAGDLLLLDDGHIELQVQRATPEALLTRVIDGGMLGQHKGINAPGVPLSSCGLTQKDQDDLRFGASLGVDMIALSFVLGPDDLHQARTLLRDAGAPDIPLVAKLERPEAIARLEDVLHACDAVMVARGDLGLELPLERVPRVQKEITRRARALGVPVIVATQVLESMRLEARPTRAEVSDAANAVDDGVDAIMLAGETAAGQYPVRAVQTLDLVIRDAETMPARVAEVEDTHLLSGHGRGLCEAAVTLAQRGDTSAIVAVTRGGKTARVLSTLRPRAPVYAATDRPAIARRLSLLWGVVPLVVDLSGDVTTAAERIGALLVHRGTLPPASVIALVSVTPDLSPGPSNFLKVERV
ncbi:MAG: pyruvate kinase [Vicinamibacterales bacterium]